MKPQENKNQRLLIYNIKNNEIITQDINFEREAAL